MKADTLPRPIVKPTDAATIELSHNRRRRDIRHSRTALVGLNLGYGVELPVHPRELGVSLSNATTGTVIHL